MKKFNLTNDEIDIILDLIDDQLSVLYNGPDGTDYNDQSIAGEAYKIDIAIMKNLKKKLENN